MEIRLVSSLTPEDEEAAAPSILEALCAVLDRMPIAYTARLRTTNGHLLDRSRPAFDLSPSDSRSTLRPP
jgi:hypothetical protein